MPSMRIRKPFAVAFVVELLVAAYIGLSTSKFSTPGYSDKGLHFVTFFIITATFYWILEASRRNVIHLSLIICTAGLGIGSEILQAVLPNGRDFDPIDIFANVVGSGLALMISACYHYRMLERRRKDKHYNIVPGDELGEDDLGQGERDLELGEGIGLHNQESGVVDSGPAASSSVDNKATDVTDELDNWDENAEDWDDDEPDSKDAGASKAP